MIDPPDFLDTDVAGIPVELTAIPTWGNWVVKMRPDRNGVMRPTKIPVNSSTGGAASVDDPRDWGPFDVALGRSARLGFNPLPDSGIFFLDVDNGRDQETGEIRLWACPIVTPFLDRTYAEVSPSQTGFKIIGYGALPTDKHIKRMPDGGQLEFFAGGKYTTVTGHRLPGSPPHLADCQDLLDAMYANLWPPEPPAPANAFPITPARLADADVVRIASGAKNGHRFRRLYLDGNAADHGDDASAADEALMCHFAFYTRDHGQLERLFGASALGKRGKWKDRADYRRRTIERALEFVSESFVPRPTRPRRKSARLILPTERTVRVG